MLPPPEKVFQEPLARWKQSTWWIFRAEISTNRFISRLLPMSPRQDFAVDAIAECCQHAKKCLEGKDRGFPTRWCAKANAAGNDCGTNTVF